MRCTSFAEITEGSRLGLLAGYNQYRPTAVVKPVVQKARAFKAIFCVFMATCLLFAKLDKTA